MSILGWTETTLCPPALPTASSPESRPVQKQGWRFSTLVGMPQISPSLAQYGREAFRQVFLACLASWFEGKPPPRALAIHSGPPMGRCRKTRRKKPYVSNGKAAPPSLETQALKEAQNGHLLETQRIQDRHEHGWRGLCRRLHRRCPRLPDGSARGVAKSEGSLPCLPRESGLWAH